MLTVFMEKKTGAKFLYLPYKSGGEAATQLVGNHTQANVNNPSENLEVWRAGQVRALCVFDKERIAYKTKVTATQSWNDIPTCKEEGLDVQYLMLRAFFLPGKVTPEQQAFYVDLLKKVSQTAEYKDYMEKQALKPIFLEGKDMLKFLEEDDKLNKQLMTEAGFVAQISGARASPPAVPARGRGDRRRRLAFTTRRWPPPTLKSSSTIRTRRKARRRRLPAPAPSTSSSTCCCSRSRRCWPTTTGGPAMGWASDGPAGRLFPVLSVGHAGRRQPLWPGQRAARAGLRPTTRS